MRPPPLPQGDECGVLFRAGDRLDVQVVSAQAGAEQLGRGVALEVLQQERFDAVTCVRNSIGSGLAVGPAHVGRQRAQALIDRAAHAWRVEAEFLPCSTDTERMIAILFSILLAKRLQTLSRCRTVHKFRGDLLFPLLLGTLKMERVRYPIRRENKSR